MTFPFKGPHCSNSDHAHCGDQNCRCSCHAAVECNADLDHPCDANNGDPCADCQDEHDSRAREWERYGRREYAQQRTYTQDMRDAGRGHLLREDERDD